MLTAFVLICSLSVTPDLQNCVRENAVTLIRLPAKFGSAATCFMQSQAYAAGTSIGRDLNDGERIKVLCVRTEMAQTKSGAVAH